MQQNFGSELTAWNFRRPLPLPVQDPDGSPTVSVEIACSWLPYIRGALLALVLQYTWPQDDPAAVYLAQQRAMSLIAMFAECPDALPPIACDYDFTLTDGGWTPISPYSSGAYSSGVGWQSIHIDANSQAWAYLEKDLTTPNVLTEVRLTYDATGSGAGPNDFVGVFLNVGAGWFIAGSATMLSGVNTFVWSGSYSDVIGIRVNINSGSNVSPFTIVDVKYQGLSEAGCE